MMIINDCVRFSDEAFAAYFEHNQESIQSTRGYQKYDSFKSFVSDFRYRILYANLVDAKSVQNNGNFYIDLVYENDIKPRVVIACKINSNIISDFYWY